MAAVAEPCDIPPIHMRGRRRAVAAESYDPNTAVEDDEVVRHPKTSEQLKCLKRAAENIIFFRKCDPDQLQVLFDAMFQYKVTPDDVIIRQGDDGDNFYVIQSGEYDVLIESGGKSDVVATLKESGFFGELALLYNCPRNATIIAKTNGVLWGLDQKTFRQVIVRATAKKRRVYEELIKGVKILDSLTNYELMNLTDALDTVIFDDETIIKEGDVADSMFFVMDGQVRVTITDKVNNQEKIVTTIGRGEYFGELALVLKKPRMASVYALGRCKCAKLDIHAFERLLGPCVEIMKRNVEFYERERKNLGLSSINDEFEAMKL